MKHSMKFLAGGMAVLASVALTAPSFADPERTYSAVGSDTIQDVWNGLSNGYTIGSTTTPAVAGSIASWNATSNGIAYQAIQTKQGGPWICRPNGSGDGATVLSQTYNPGDSASTAWSPAGATASPATCQTAHLNGSNAVDFARSSSGPSAGTGLTYVAFARDAVSVAYNTDTNTADGASAGIPAGLNLTTTDLQVLYSGKIPSGYTGPVNITDPNYTPATAGDYSGDTDAINTPNTGAGTGLQVTISGVPVTPELPQGSSGTRKFFIASALGLSNTVGGNAKYVYDPATNGLPENNATDGRLTGTSTVTGLPAVPGALIPFSAAQWLSQLNGAAPNTLGANVQIASLNGSAAVDTTTTPASQGALFGTKNSISGKYTDTPGSGTGVFERDTYDVVPTTFLGGSATAGQSTLSSILTGSAAGQLGSGAARTVIQTYGFGYLSYLGNSSNAAAEIAGAWKG